MSDNIPFEIQMEIIKKVSNVKSLVQFRSVSKQWKSFIDSSHFIKGYGARHTQPHSRILRCKSGLENTSKYIHLVDDDIETFKVQQKEFAVSPLLKQYPASFVVGASHGLLCLLAFNSGNDNAMIVLWNPSIQKSVGISVLSLETYIGFGVCPVTRDPTVVKFVHPYKMACRVEVFTLSSGVWNMVPSCNLPRQSIKLNSPTQVVIDRFIYWGACETTFANDGEFTRNLMVVSFDLITKEFKVVDLPDSLTNELFFRGVMGVSVSKLRGSLVVYGDINAEGALCYCCGVWMMEKDSSFRKLFTIGAHVSKILGFSKSGETIFVIRNEGVRFTTTTLNVYDPYSQQIKNLLGISGVESSFSMGSYKESLLLLDHSDLHIYSDDS
ncbi:probable LRR receptor-like serine/threonine-protein kinase isoform X2 [Tanacetum coccineum]